MHNVGIASAWMPASNCRSIGEETGTIMKTIQMLLIVVALAVLSACATTPISIDAAQSVPSERQFVKQSVSDNSQGAFVDFVCDAGWTESLGKAYLSIDGIDYAALAPSEKISVLLLPGEHIFTVRAMESKSAPFARPRSANGILVSGKRYLYRIGWFDGQALQIEPWASE